MSDNGSSRLPGLLGKLGKMTSIRDTEVLEQSLLRTLGPLLGVLDTSLYRTDDQQNMVRVLNYHRSKVIEADGVARMVERVEEVSRLSDLPQEVLALTDNIRLLGKPCTRKIGKDLLVGYPLLGATMSAVISCSSATVKCRLRKMRPSAACSRCFPTITPCSTSACATG